LMCLTEENMTEIFRRDKHPIRLELTDLIGQGGGAPAQLPDTMDVNTGIIDRLMIASPGVRSRANDAACMARLSEQTRDIFLTHRIDGLTYELDQAPELTPGPFDLVFTTWGTICWLPDAKQWAKIIAAVLAPGGELYFADAHPAFTVMEECAGKLVPTYDFQTPADRPLHFANETTYTGDPTIMSHRSTREWIHSLSGVLGGLIDAGLTITMFREHEVLPWRGLPSLVPASERLWRLADGEPRMPLSYSVRAKKTS